jgi:hypothetical protein
MKQSTRIGALLVAACLALAAFGAVTASAEVVNAKFSANNIKLATTGVTVEKNAAEPKLCTTTTRGPATGETFTGAFFASNNVTFQTEFDCPSASWLDLGFYGAEVKYDTVTGKYSVTMNKEVGGGFESPWGTYQAKQPTVTWTNGSGATNSTITFSKTLIGTSGGGTGFPLTLTGTFTATTKAGGLLTLSH